MTWLSGRAGSLAACTAALLSTAGLAAGASKTTGEDVSHQAEKTAQTAEKYASEKRDEFERRMGTKLDEVQKNLHELHRQAERDRVRAKKNLDQLLADADAKGKDAEKRMDEVKKATGEAWRDLKKGTETAVDDFAKGVDRAKK